MEAKIDFLELFFDVFFERVLASIFDRFLKAPNLKIRAPVEAKRYFFENRRFQKMFEKTSILEQFWEAKIEKNQ